MDKQTIEELVQKHYAEWVADKDALWTECMTKALKDQADTHAIEMRAYEATVQNQDERIRQLEAERVPDGWQRVPKQITTEMADAYWLAYDKIFESSHLGVCYAAMLAAAPKKERECVHRFMYFGDQPNRRCADCNAIEGAAP